MEVGRREGGRDGSLWSRGRVESVAGGLVMG